MTTRWHTERSSYGGWWPRIITFSPVVSVWWSLGIHWMVWIELKSNWWMKVRFRMKTKYCKLLQIDESSLNNVERDDVTQKKIWPLEIGVQLVEAIHCTAVQLKINPQLVTWLGRESNRFNRIRKDLVNECSKCTWSRPVQSDLLIVAL